MKRRPLVVSEPQVGRWAPARFIERPQSGKISLFERSELEILVKEAAGRSHPGRAPRTINGRELQD